MTPSKQDALFKRYPKIFTKNGCSYLECGDGWYDLLDVLCSNIQSRVDHKLKQQQYEPESNRLPQDEIQVSATQVKEKFGGLRFYVNYYDDEIRGMISLAESLSTRICEDCGAPGESSKSGWIRTMCVPCRRSFDRRRTGKLDDT